MYFGIRVDGPQSVILAQAENRLHLQKAVLAELIAANEARRRSPEVSSPAATPSGRG